MAGFPRSMIDPVTKPRRARAGSPELRLELTCDDEPIVYCEACWEREFGDDSFGSPFFQR